MRALILASSIRKEDGHAAEEERSKRATVRAGLGSLLITSSTLLRSAEIQKDQLKYREVVQKVIMYMTLGVDVSPLFSEMIMVGTNRRACAYL